MSAPAPTNTVLPPATPVNPTPTVDVVPSAATLVSAAKLAIQRDMPIQLDYFVDSAEGKAFLGEDATTSEKMLVKNSEEYTSHINKIYKAGEDFIILTENSIYIVSSKVQKRKIQASSLRGE
jgi:hypothetical protein|uniref:Uncharacterized protein n=1 Tax=viral metagenome TaxID=1070528 RepID=A0A6C0DJI1_9ZZZZ